MDKPLIKNQAAAKTGSSAEIVLLTPEFVNQPYYYDKDDNKLIKLESPYGIAYTKKKTLGVKRRNNSFP